MEHKKDYSLLRQFDLEAAKRGERLQTKYGDEREFVGGHSADGTVCVAGKSGQYYLEHPSELRISPLAWVEGRPVYRGDTVYTTEGRAVVVSNTYREYAVTDGQWVVECCSATWTKPKQKREGWVNIYPHSDAFYYDTKEEADKLASDYRIACCHIEWEE